MKKADKIKAEKKADLALCKLQDLFYMNINGNAARKLNDACDKVRELISAIENSPIER